MSVGSITKRSADSLNYTFDFSQWLASGDSVASATWTVPSGLTQVSSSTTSTTAVVKISGGTVGTSYTITCAMTTTVSTETKTETFTIRVIS